MKKREVIVLISILILDLITKHLISTNMTLGESIPVIDGFFSITFIHNTGAAWGMMKGNMTLFYLFTVIGLGLFGWWFYQSKPNQGWYRIALVMMIAGTLGNVVDRLAFQYVRDFLDFRIFGYDFPIFNVADMSLVIGVGILLLLLIVKPEEIGDV